MVSFYESGGIVSSPSPPLSIKRRNNSPMIHEQQQWKAFSLTHVTYPAGGGVVPKLFALLSLLPIFIVVAMTASTLLYKDVIAAYMLVGSIISSVIVDILKCIMKQPRPSRYNDDIEGEDKDCGMPSNHSTFVFFCWSFVVMYILRGRKSLLCQKLMTPDNTNTTTNMNQQLSPSFELLTTLWYHLHNVVAIFASLYLAIGCAYSRIYLGYHTPNQVFVGSSLGMVLGVLWYNTYEIEIVQKTLILIDSLVHELEMSRRIASMNECTSNGTKKKD